MALADYDDLQDAIVTWAFRTGDTQFADQAPDFIALCEQMFNYGLGDRGPLRCPDMETIATATLTNSEVLLPSDYLEWRDVRMNNTRPSLTFATLDESNSRYGTTSGVAKEFTIVGDRLIVYPATSGTIKLYYYAKVPALSDENPTNWLLTKAPGAYLYGSLLQAAPFMMDQEPVAVWSTMFNEAIAGLNLSSKRHSHSRTGVVLRGATP